MDFTATVTFLAHRAGIADGLLGTQRVIVTNTSFDQPTLVVFPGGQPNAPPLAIFFWQRSRALLPSTTLNIHHWCCCGIANIQLHDHFLNLVRTQRIIWCQEVGRRHLSTGGKTSWQHATVYGNARNSQWHCCGITNAQRAQTIECIDNMGFASASAGNHMQQHAHWPMSLL